MGLKLLAGPANAGKVACLLERYLGALQSDPFLIVPNRPDVDRAERQLLGQAGALLGGVDRHDATGFFGAAEPGRGKRLAAPLPPPDLVIQDELHLISGPLGTMAGLYEAAIEALCVREIDGRAVRPKIVASTATVRRAQDQIQALFARPLTQVFPPPGPDRRDAFLARTVPASKVPDAPSISE